MSDIITNALQATGISELNEMQQTSLRANESGRDIVLLSPTGSGKTLAFLLPLLKQMKRGIDTIQALVIAPSRELALQIEEVFRSLKSDFRITCCYGGHPFEVEKNALTSHPDLLVGTPGRILDHIKQQSFSPESIKFLVLDEFDKSLELGFQKEMEAVIAQLTGVKKRMMLSATRAEEIPAFTKIHHPMVLDFLGNKETLQSLKVYSVQSPIKDKLETLLKLVCTIGNQPTLIFCNYRESVERIANFLKKNGLDCRMFHGGMEQVDREKSLFQFRNGTSYLLVSTDLASRGLDIPEIQNVVHYHLPINKESYTHRNGRTARMYAEGDAYLILHGEEHLPDFLEGETIEPYELPDEIGKPQPSEWASIYIGKGKRDKLSKGDIAGFLMKKGELGKDDLGRIEVKEQFSFATVRRTKLHAILQKVRGEKIKGMKTIFEEAK
jgi:Superfamily II DNA and RNA helicases